MPPGACHRLVNYGCSITAEVMNAKKVIEMLFDCLTAVMKLYSEETSAFTLKQCVLVDRMTQLCGATVQFDITYNQILHYKHLSFLSA